MMATLTPQCERELIAAAQQGDSIAYDELIRSCWRFICGIADVFTRKRRGAIWDDLTQEGAIALVDCISRFDVSKKTRLTTFAAVRIRGAMQDYLRSMNGRGGSDRAEFMSRIHGISHYEYSDSGKEITLEFQCPRCDRNRQLEKERDRFETLLARFPGTRIRHILRRYFFDGLSMKEISEELGVSESRISQFINSETRRMRDQLGSRKEYSQLS